MNRFPSIKKLDGYILYNLELASSLSVLCTRFLTHYLYGQCLNKRFSAFG